MTTFFVKFESFRTFKCPLFPTSFGRKVFSLDSSDHLKSLCDNIGRRYNNNRSDAKRWYISAKMALSNLFLQNGVVTCVVCCEMWVKCKQMFSCFLSKMVTSLMLEWNFFENESTFWNSCFWGVEYNDDIINIGMKRKLKMKAHFETVKTKGK